MVACTFGRVENVNLWLDTFKDWEIGDRVLTFNGGTALNLCARIGQNTHQVFDVLIRRGAPTMKYNYLGMTVLQYVENVQHP